MDEAPDVSKLSHEQLTMLLETMSDAFYALDPDWRFVYLNPSAARLWGEARETLLGENIWQRFPQALGGVHHEAHLRAAGERRRVTYQTISPLGDRWVEAHIHPSEAGLAVYLRDLTERRQAEAALGRSEARFGKVIRAAPIAAVLTSLREDRILDTNQAFERLTGHHREAVLGRTLGELDLWLAGHERDVWERTGDPDETFHDLERRLRTKSGAVRDVLVSGTVLDQEGEGGILLRMFYDITERRQTEAQLTQAIQLALQDTSWLSRLVMEKLALLRLGGEGQPDLASLSPRERAVLELLAQGLANNAIAAELSLSKQTVRNYVTHIYQKIGVLSRAEAIVWARERGLGGF